MAFWWANMPTLRPIYETALERGFRKAIQVLCEHSEQVLRHTQQDSSPYTKGIEIETQHCVEHLCKFADGGEGE